MVILNLTPREERSGVDFTINADFSDSDGDANRTYTLGNPNFLQANGIEIVIQGLDATQGAGNDFTVASGVVTFLNNIDDDMNIIFRYFTGTSDGGVGANSYAAGTDVQAILQLKTAFSGSSTPTLDDVNIFLAMSADQIDQLTQHAWRELTVTDEFYNFPFRSHAGLSWGMPGWTGIPIHLRHRKIRTLDNSEGDKLEIWNGSSYEDWVVTKSEGRDEDYWMDEEQGILYVRFYYPYFREKAIRLTYRYGETSVPNDIRKASAYQAAIMVLESDDRSMLLNDTGESNTLPYDNRVTNWNRQVKKLLHNRIEIPVIDA